MENNQELQTAVAACGRICGIVQRELGLKYTSGDFDNAQRRPFFGVTAAINKLHANHKATGSVDAQIAEAMCDISPEISARYFSQVMPMELQGVFGLAYSKASLGTR